MHRGDKGGVRRGVVKVRDGAHPGAPPPYGLYTIMFKFVRDFFGTSLHQTAHFCTLAPKDGIIRR